ncbi:hypothetical protein BCR36DRAFT_316082 [Piromyces finnis]|uniref:DNA polymerase delta subunit 3 n=1 Tax=Piromyces finnis TaxID=1754191 RepID=A0A1Y1VLW4_9FUNG|nr:hypothetical protein BCR36DRAFT_316082 [Piromyces finnis]|eukprot:ORX59926.1 hypothetical protein BCR36DRAFT_316082 [Piromyces finnis]
MNQYYELLNSNVYDKKNIVTYRWLSRKINVNVNQAKEILYEFKASENDKIHCVYCISGQLIKNNELSIELIPEEKLEETKQKFQNYFIHIYSVEAQSLKELDPLIAENYDIINNIDDNLQDYSMIHCDYIHKRERKIEGTSIDDIQNEKPESSINSKFNNSNNSLKDIKKEKNDLLKKISNNKKASKAKDAKASFFEKFKTKSVFEADNDVSNKKQIKKEIKSSMDKFLKDKDTVTSVKKEEEISEEKAEPMKIDVEEPKITKEKKIKMIEEENKNMEVDKEIEEENERLRHLFDDDDLSTPINRPSGNKKIVIDDDDDDDDEEEENEVEDDNYNIISNELEEKPKKLVKSDDPREKGRKRYRVVKSKTYIDDKGYLVTEDVSDWESASDNEETIVQKPKQKSLFDMHNHNKRKNDDTDNDNDKKVKKRKGGTEKTQKSILSFFGKR